MGPDAKVLCVPAHDPRWDDVNDLADVPDHLLHEIEHFFDYYKTIEPGKGATTAAGKARPPPKAPSPTPSPATTLPELR